MPTALTYQKLVLGDLSGFWMGGLFKLQKFFFTPP